MSDTLSIISAAFAKAILSQENRPIRLRWSQREAHLEELLLVQRVEISEALFEGMRGHLTCISIDPDLPLHELIGQPLGIEMVNDRGGLHHINGLITEARAGHADGALRVYQLTLRDALSVMDGRINTRIFRCKSVPEILHLLLREWRLRSPTLAHAFSFDLHRLNDRSYPSREITHQFNESDAHFIGRLCRREGITWYIATPQAADDPAGASGPVHTLVFCDQVAQLPQASTGSISSSFGVFTSLAGRLRESHWKNFLICMSSWLPASDQLRFKLHLHREPVFPIHRVGNISQAASP